MSQISKLVVDYLNASYGENPEFEKVETGMYNPYTFAVEKKTTHTINGQHFCKVMFNNEIEISSRLLTTLVLLFDVELSEIHPVIEDWFLSKISKVNLSDVRPNEKPTQT